ncbi:MAG: hypothetical protein JXR46_15755 [Calditrichaceae bacterium]|nr:hypothetical protein [Calditrichaceae bacterium]
MPAIIGTVPDQNFPLVHGFVKLSGNNLLIGNHMIPVNRGTPASLAAAIKASEALGGPEIYAFLTGDIGRGNGSRNLYEFLTNHIQEFSFDIITFHYLHPILHWHNRLLPAFESMKPRPLLIADAGFMYVAKMSGQAFRYDVFTPDIGELAFLADEMAPHPFYTRGFIMHQEANAPELINRAYTGKNSAKALLVKGAKDYIVSKNKIIATVDNPSFEAMEAIGGTGDSLTGLLTLLCAMGYDTVNAAILAAQTNRWTGYFANPNPASQIIELIEEIPRALLHVLNNYQTEKTNVRN